MKLSELKNIAEECDYEFKEEKGDYFVKRNINVIEIGKKQERRIWIKNPKFCSDKDFKMIKACIEFSETPNAEREDILNNEEHEYLKAVIRPFRKNIRYFTKRKDFANHDFIYMSMKTPNVEMRLPSFERDTMYKNMELNKKYTLEELGL